MTWEKKPGTVENMADFKDIAYVLYSEGYDTYSEETGYSPSWIYETATDENGNELWSGGTHYTDNAIIGFDKNKEALIYDFDGNATGNETFHTMSRDDVIGMYLADDDDINNQNKKCFDEHFNIKEQYIDGVGGDYEGQNMVYVNGSIYTYNDMDIVSYKVENQKNDGTVLTMGEPEDIATIIPALNNTDGENEQKMVGVLEEQISVDKPDYFVINKGSDCQKLPNGMQPVYYPEILKADEMTPKSENYNTAFVNGVVKLYDRDNKVRLWDYTKNDFVTDQAFDDATYYEDGLIGVKKDDKWAFMNRDGKLVTNYVFDKVSALYNGKAYAKYHGKIGILDLNKYAAKGN